MDAAIAAFEEDVDELLAERAELIDGGADDLEDAVNAIFDEAEQACDDGDDAKEVRTAFM